MFHEIHPPKTMKATKPFVFFTPNFGLNSAAICVERGPDCSHKNWILD